MGGYTYYISQPSFQFSISFVTYISMWYMEDNLLYVALRAHLVLMLGVGLPAQLILAVGPLAQPSFAAYGVVILPSLGALT